MMTLPWCPDAYTNEFMTKPIHTQDTLRTGSGYILNLYLLLCSPDTDTHDQAHSYTEHPQTGSGFIQADHQSEVDIYW